jgi:hypothetical protein
MAGKRFWSETQLLAGSISACVTRSQVVARCSWSKGPAGIGKGATLDGLAGFAIVQSYLSTAAKWGIDYLDALTQLFTAGPWLPAAIRSG